MKNIGQINIPVLDRFPSMQVLNARPLYFSKFLLQRKNLKGMRCYKESQFHLMNNGRLTND